MQLTLEIATYSLALWLGLYLIARDPAKPRLRYAGLGLTAYALSLAVGSLAQFAPASTQVFWIRLHWSLLFFPAIFWLGTMIYILPEETGYRSVLARGWRYGFLPGIAILALLGATTPLIFDVSENVIQPGPVYPLFVAMIVILLLGALGLITRIFFAAGTNWPLGILLVATIFFALAAGLLLWPFEWLPRTWLILGISLDLISLGLVIAVLDAFEEGETLLPDFFRSFDGAIFYLLLFAGPVVLTIWLTTGVTFAMLALLLTIIGAAIAAQTLADPFQTALDRVAFAAFPGLRRARADLRTTARSLPRINEGLQLDALDEEEFIRLTRRTLSHLGNLPRLASSPLTRLPQIERRLAQRNAPDDTLERAAELKQLLTESITRLKPPQTAEDFGTSEAWRYYNALYYPYVVGLKPYSRRAVHNGLDSAEKEVLEWFRTYVPERTLYNWQNAAARLVAQQLRERM